MGDVVRGKLSDFHSLEYSGNLRSLDQAEHTMCKIEDGLLVFKRRLFSLEL